MKKNLLIAIMLASSLSMANNIASDFHTSNVKPLASENTVSDTTKRNAEDIDIGEIPNTVFLNHNSDTHTYTIYGHGKINRYENGIADKLILQKYIDNTDTDAILKIEDGVFLPDNSSYLFSKFNGKAIEFSKTLNTTNVTNMEGLFENCKNIKVLDLSNFDTTNVTNMSYMFQLDKSLNEIKGIENFKLDNIDFDNSNENSLYDMFNGCESISNLDISNWVVPTYINKPLLNGLRINNSLIINSSTLKDIYSYHWRAYNIDTNNSISKIYKIMGSDDTIYYVNSGTINKTTMFKKYNIEDYINDFQYPEVKDGVIYKIQPLLANENAELIKKNKTSLISIIDNLYSLNEHQIKILKEDINNAKTFKELVNIKDIAENMNSQLGNSQISDIGETPNTVFISYNNKLDTYTIYGEGKIKSDIFEGENRILKQYVHSDNNTILKISKGVQLPDNSRGLFNEFKGKSITFDKGIDTSNVYDMGGMFYGCSNLKELDLSMFKMYNVNNMDSMFEDCENIININVTNWEFRNDDNKNLDYMFANCTKLERIVGLNNGIHTIQLTRIKNASNMFENCKSIKTLDITWLIRNIKYYKTNVSKMFNNYQINNGLKLSSQILKESLKSTNNETPKILTNNSISNTYLILDTKNNIIKTITNGAITHNDVNDLNEDEYLIVPKINESKDDTIIPQDDKHNQRPSDDYIMLKISKNDKYYKLKYDTYFVKKSIFFGEIRDILNKNINTKVGIKFNDQWIQDELGMINNDYVIKRDLIIHPVIDKDNNSDNLTVDEPTKKIDLTKYDKYLKTFNSYDTTITNGFSKGLYLNANIGNLFSLVNKFEPTNLITKAQVGYTFDTHGVLLTPFAEYYKEKAYNVTLGLGTSYKDLKTFVRYRLATLDKKVSNNIDLYVNYSHKFNIKDFYITPEIGGLGTYGIKTKLDDDVYLNNRAHGTLDGGITLGYNLQDLSLYTKQQGRVSFDNTKIYQESNKDNMIKSDKLTWEYKGIYGINKTINNNVKVGSNISLGINSDKEIKTDLGVNLGYMW